MKSVLSVIALVSMCMLFSCSEEAVDAKSRVVQDSLVNVLPQWQALKIKIGDNNTSMLIVVGDATFYKATPEEKSKKATELGEMILRIFGKGNYLEKGNLIVTADIHNTSEAPADGIAVPIDFEALKKSAGK